MPLFKMTLQVYSPSNSSDGCMICTPNHLSTFWTVCLFHGSAAFTDGKLHYQFVMQKDEPDVHWDNNTNDQSQTTHLAWHA